MSRRTLATAVLAAGLLTSGAAPFLAPALAGGCASWNDPGPDPSNDAVVSGQAATEQPNMEILSASLTTVGTDIVASIKLKALSSSYTDVGDRFVVQASFGGPVVRFLADRDDTGSFASVQNISGTKGVATADWDLQASTVTITATQAELDKAAGKSTKGLDATSLGASTGTQLNGTDGLYGYDTASAPAAMTYTVGGVCSPPIPAATLPMPTADCGTKDSATNDGTASGSVPNDPDLDITSFALNSTPTALYVYLKVAALGDKPANFQGDRFEFNFKVGANAYTYAVGRMTVGRNLNKTTYGAKGGAANAALWVKGVFLKAQNTVVMIIDRAGLEKVNAAPVPDGTTVTTVYAKSVAMVPEDSFDADTVKASTGADVWTIGDNPCFPPPPGVLTNTGKTTAQYTDAAAVAAKLTNAAGTALVGKTVTFKVGSTTVPGATGSDGVATASLNPGLAFGSYSLVTSFAGDSSASAVSITTPFTVTLEKTRILLSVKKYGSKRTVTAKLLDDDNHPVAGQVVTWYINGKKVSAPRTNSSGVVTLTTAKPTQTVKAVFAGVSGKYVKSSAQMKV